MESTQQNDEPREDSSPENTDKQGAEAAENAADAGEAALAEAEARASEFKDKYLRAAAEMENMRRRMEKERTDLLQFGLDKIMSDLLPVLDAFDKAHSDASASEQGVKNPLFEGLELLQKQLKSTLEKHGLSEVNPIGEAFDPNLHQAIQKIDRDDVEVESVHEVYQKGYQLNSRLVRPAMVSVAMPTNKSE